MKRVVAAFVMAAGLAAPAAAQVDLGPLAAARDLYASARYDEALTVLNGLRGADRGDLKSVEQYRSLCLLALGRATEAESAIAAVVTADPLYQPGETDASPRVRATFTEVRRRLLPDIATARYRTAKATYDQKDWAAAEEQFRLVLSLLDDPDMGGRLSDLRVLAVGFLELSAKAAAPPPPAPEPVPTPAPVAPEPVAPPAPALPELGKIYGADDPEVAPPTVVRQEIPKVPSMILPMAKARGLLEIVIDDQGRVVSIVTRSSIHPTYDSQLISAAKDWKYEPARFNGYPVKFRKLIQIAVVK
jgi:hypothetical protein